MDTLSTHYARLLGLDEAWRFDSVDLRLEERRVEIRLAHVGSRVWCPDCGQSCGLADHAEERRWRHLDTIQFTTELIARLPRCRCPEHGVNTIVPPWAGKHSQFTLLFEALAIEVLRECRTFKAAAFLLGLRANRVAGARSVAKAGCVKEGARDVAGPPKGRRQDRLVTSRRRCVLTPYSARGTNTGGNPSDRRRKGSKHPIATDANGIPLAAALTGANEHEVIQMIPLMDAIPAVRGKPGRPRRRLERVQGDRAYDSKHQRAMLQERGIEAVTARWNTEHGSDLGTTRCVVERSVSGLHRLRRLRVRAERRADIHEALWLLAVSS